MGNSQKDISLISENGGTTIAYITKKIDSILHCGNISMSYFAINFNSISEFFDLQLLPQQKNINRHGWQYQKLPFHERIFRQYQRHHPRRGH